MTILSQSNTRKKGFTSKQQPSIDMGSCNSVIRSGGKIDKNEEGSKRLGKWKTTPTRNITANSATLFTNQFPAS